MRYRMVGKPIFVCLMKYNNEIYTVTKEALYLYVIWSTIMRCRMVGKPIFVRVMKYNNEMYSVAKEALYFCVIWSTIMRCGLWHCKPCICVSWSTIMVCRVLQGSLVFVSHEVRKFYAVCGREAIYLCVSWSTIVKCRLWHKKPYFCVSYEVQ